MKPNLLIVNQYYAPDFASTGQLLTQLTQSLAQDFSITMITTFPSYSYDDATNKRRWWQIARSEQLQGVRVLRLFSTAFHRRGMLARLCNYFSFLCSATIALLVLRKPDLVVVQTDPPIIGL